MLMYLAGFLSHDLVPLAVYVTLGYTASYQSGTSLIIGLFISLCCDFTDVIMCDCKKKASICNVYRYGFDAERLLSFHS